MALILVVEQEARYVERIRDALTSEGWQVRVAGDREQALEAASREPPQLVLVSRQAEGAESLLETFARRTGGPGTVALLPEHSTDLEDPLADEAVAKPFTDQDLRLAVRRGLRPASSRPAAPAAGAPAAQAATASNTGPSDAGAEAAEPKDKQLTAQDIFGDLVAEVESEMQQEPPQPPPEPTPEPASKPAPAVRSSSGELDLEKTLSGLRRDLALGGGTAKGASVKPAQAKDRSDLATTRPKRTRSSSIDDLSVDALLTETLSGLDLPQTKKKRESPPKPEAAAQATPAPRPGEGAATRKLDWDQLRAAAKEAKEATPEDPPPETAVAKTAAAENDTAVGSEAPQDPREISFADLSAPSLHEIAEPIPPSLFGGREGGDGGDDEEIDLELEVDLSDGFEGDLDAGMREAAGEDTAGEGEPEPVASLGDWLESGGDSMFVPSEEILEELEGRPAQETSSPEISETPAEVAKPAARSASAPAGSAAADGGQRFGQYTLLDRIAVGGMAEVWKARMSGVEGFQKTVAIKKILPHLTDNDDFVNMFVDEAKLAAQLSHPNIIHIYDLGKIGDHFYIAMEYVEGKNLRALLNESRRKALPLPRSLALLIAARLASALDHAHRKKDFEDRELGLVHRDVSPQNVLISQEGDIKLCDFGIVKAVSKASQTQMGALKGKLQYMSPEQAWGKDVDARSDIFSLGAILFEMLTGRRLFTGDSELSVLEAVRQCQVIAPRDLVPGIPEAVEAVNLRALEMDPGRRYQSAGQMQQELEDILYSDKPAPGPADLAEFLDRLAKAPETDEADRVASGRERGAAAPAGTGPTGTGPTGTGPTETTTGTGTGTTATGTTATGATATGTATGTTATGASATAGPAREAPDAPRELLTATEPPEPGEYADYDFEELAEGGGRGRLWLWIVLALVLVAGGAVAYYLYALRPQGQSPAPATESPAVEPVPVPPSPLDQELEGEDEDAFDDAPADEPEPVATGAIDSGASSDAVASAAADAPPPEPAARTAAARPPPEPRPVPREPAPEPTSRTAAARSQPTPPARAFTPPSTGTTATTNRATRENAGNEVASDRPEPAKLRPATGRETETVDIASPAAPAARTPSAAPSTTATTEAGGAAGDETRTDGQTETDDEAEAEPSQSEPASDRVWLRPPRSPGLGAEQEETGEREEAEEPGAGEAETEPEPAPQPPPDPEVRTGDLVGPGPGVVAPVLVRFDKPSYPPIARRMKVQGDVVLSLLVDENGRVVETRVIQGVRGGAGLNEAATQAARRAQYRPATKNGMRVKMWTTLKIPFRL